MFNPYRKPKKEELDHLQKIVDDIYSDFISKVSRNRKIEISFVKNNVGALIYSSNQAKEKFLIDDVLDYESFISNIIKENNFDDYKIYENKDKSTLIFDFLTNYKSPNNKYSNTKICNKLQTSINVITPFFLRDC